MRRNNRIPLTAHTSRSIRAAVTPRVRRQQMSPAAADLPSEQQLEHIKPYTEEDVKDEQSGEAS